MFIHLSIKYLVKYSFTRYSPTFFWATFKFIDLNNERFSLHSFIYWIKGHNSNTHPVSLVMTNNLQNFRNPSIRTSLKTGVILHCNYNSLKDVDILHSHNDRKLPFSQKIFQLSSPPFQWFLFTFHKRHYHSNHSIEFGKIDYFLK